MRTAIRDLGWLFLFLGGLKSLMGLMGFRGDYRFYGPYKSYKTAPQHQPSITTSLPQPPAFHNHQPSITTSLP